MPIDLNTYFAGGFERRKAAPQFLTNLCKEVLTNKAAIELDSRVVKSLYSVDLPQCTGGRFHDLSGYESFKYKIPQYNDYTALTDKWFLERPFGAIPYGERVADAVEEVSKNQGIFSDFQANSKSKQVADGLLNGELTLHNGDKIKFNKKSTHDIAAVKKYSDASAKIVDELMEGCQLIVDDGKVADCEFHFISNGSVTNPILLNDGVQKLAKRMDTSKSNAKRLIMTESARMENEGLLSYYQRIGAKQLIFVATLDMKTSEICRAMDGTIIPIEDAKIGLNVPPLHPYCRSVISPHYEGNEPGDRVYRDVETGKTKSGRYRTYKEYLEEELGDKEQAAALASTRNDLQTLIKALSVVPVNNVAKQSNGAIDINPSEELFKRNQDSYNDFKERHIDEFTEEMEEQIEKDLKEILDENDMATRVSMENLNKILEDGRIKSQFETGKSSTTINADIRKEIEKTLFGYNLDLKDSLRPIYGYLTNFKNGFDGSSVNGSIMYGNVAIKLKKSNLSNRTTFTFGDSLNGTRWDVKVPSLFTNPSKISISANRSLTDNYGKFIGRLPKDLKDITENIPYVELQFHGGVSIKDIEKIYIYKSFDTWRGKQSLNIDDKVLEKITDKLDKLKIDYEVVE